MSHFSKLLHVHDDLVTNVWNTGEAFLQPQHNFVILTVCEPLGKRCSLNGSCLLLTCY